MHSQSSSASIRLASKPCFHRRRRQNEVDIPLSSTPTAKIIKEDSDDVPTNDKNESDRVQTLLRLFHDSLLEQFVTVEAVYDVDKVPFEIQTDS